MEGLLLRWRKYSAAYDQQREKKSIIQGLLEAYGQAIQDALKELRGSTIKEMIESEMTLYFGYGKSEWKILIKTAMGIY